MLTILSRSSQENVRIARNTLSIFLNVVEEHENAVNEDNKTDDLAQG